MLLGLVMSWSVASVPEQIVVGEDVQPGLRRRVAPVQRGEGGDQLIGKGQRVAAGHGLLVGDGIAPGDDVAVGQRHAHHQVVDIVKNVF